MIFSEDALVVAEFLYQGRIALITLNRPHVLNALNTAMGLQLCSAFSEIVEKRSVRAIVITGAGDRAFSTGGDLKERMTMTSEEWIKQHRIFERFFGMVRNCPKPVFAAVNGLALGGGCELAMNTDFIIASENAKFGQPEVKRGIIPGCGGTQFLPRYLPRGLALELLVTGKLIDAEEAHKWGLVNHVFPRERLIEAAQDIATQIADNSPIAVRQARRAAKTGLELPIESGIEIELECYQRVVVHPDRLEGVAAFNERRRPDFADDEDGTQG